MFFLIQKAYFENHTNRCIHPKWTLRLKSMAVVTEYNNDIKWTHMAAVSNEDLNSLAQQQGYPQQLIQDCLQPEHLPKLEKVDETLFCLLRYYDSQCPKNSNTIQALTRKVAVFLQKDQVLSLQRSEDHIFSDLQKTIKVPVKSANKYQYVFLKLFKKAISTYDEPIQAGLLELQQFESSVFESDSKKVRMSRFYNLKRKATMFTNLLRMSSETLAQFSEHLDKSVKSAYQDAKELLEKLLFNLKEISDNILSLISLQVSLSSHKLNELSHKTNEIIRVLTIFSVFFLPLNFIAGLYGMNFEHMPELKWIYGYPTIIAVMVAIVSGLFLWFWRKGWLQD